MWGRGEGWRWVWGGGAERGGWAGWGWGGCAGGGGGSAREARWSLRADGIAGPVHDPLVVEVVPPANMAVGSVPWGLGAWVPPPSVRRISTAAGPAGATAGPDGTTAGYAAGPDGTAAGSPDGTAAGPAGSAAGALAAAAGRSLVIVVRDAHRYPAARELVRALLAARPDAIVVEMGLPVWRPPAGGYVATYGAARTSGQAAAETLGFACR